ncbi:MAG: GCD complex subunit gcd7 [Peltula sp. TS41687]|nr:MAG: GCD complex subunit gcd7 [Peltula sp. TS41687]
MPSTASIRSPGLHAFLKSLQAHSVESSIERLISLLKRRQIKHSRPCAVATAHLLMRVVTSFRWTEVESLIERIQQVGQRLCAAQPRELVVGNIVRRVLGLIREEAEDDRDADTVSVSEGGTDSQVGSSHGHERSSSALHRPGLSGSISTCSPLRHGATQPADAPAVMNTSSTTTGDLSESFFFGSTSDLSSRRPPLLTSHTSYAVHTAAPMATSMFNLFSHDDASSPTATPPGTQSPVRGVLTATQLAKIGALTQRDLKPDILGGIEEIIDEVDQVDDQIAAYALDHIHSNEIILTHGSSLTVQRFLLKAAAKRKFTVVHAESHPNDHEVTHAIVTGQRRTDLDDDDLTTDAFQKSLAAAGITVILIPDSAVFALMSRVNKVILGTHAVLANGGLVAAAGARMIAQAARTHQTPVVIVSGVYKLSPVYPFDFEALIEYGDAGKVLPYDDGTMVEHVDIENPLYDYVPAELVNLYITNLGGHAPSYLYRIVSDHYRVEDINL